MLKIELHAHTDEDPEDRISYSTETLVEHAATLGYGAIAITLHDRYFNPTRHTEFARARGLVLLSGIERTIQGHHVLLINFPTEVALVNSFEDIARLKAMTQGLVIAPHPFYPLPSALRLRLDRYASLVDAIEINAMYTRLVNFNRRAVTWAQANQKPLVGTTDLHVLDQMGTTYTLVDAPPDADAICEAIRSGRVNVRSEPLSTARAAGIIGRMVLSGVRGRLRRATAQRGE